MTTEIPFNKHLARSIRYQRAILATGKARAEHESASRGISLAQVQERCAELASQSFASVGHGSLHGQLGDLTDREREIGIAFAQYAVYGRSEE